MICAAAAALVLCLITHEAAGGITTKPADSTAIRAASAGENWQKIDSFYLDCASDHAIHVIKSKMEYKDYKYTYMSYFGCKKISAINGNCYWTDWINYIDNYQQLPSKMTCNELENEYVSGVQTETKYVSSWWSYNIHQQWRMKCCKSSEVETTTCTTADFVVKKSGELFYYEAQGNQFIEGLEIYMYTSESWPDEERRGKIHYCNYIARKQREQCEDGSYLSALSSTYDSQWYDRNWNFKCRKAAHYFDSCSWTEYLNGLDDPLHAECETANHFINGIESYFVAGRNDRRYRIRCCKSNHVKLIECSSTTFINQYREAINYEVPDGHVIQKLESYHDDNEEDRRWKMKTCKHQYELHSVYEKSSDDDYSYWCQSISNNAVNNDLLSTINTYLVEDGELASAEEQPTQCDQVHLYNSRKCIYHRAITVGKKLVVDVAKITDANQLNIVYKMWRVHPWLRELCPTGYDTSYFKVYLEYLSKFHSDFSSYTHPLYLNNAKELREEVTTHCSIQPQDPFCSLKLVFHFVDRYERLSPNQKTWNEQEWGFKEAIMLNFVVLKTNNPEKFSSLSPDASGYTKQIVHITEVLLQYMFNNDLLGLANYGFFLPSLDFYKCGGLACDGDNTLCMFMKLISQTRVFAKTYSIENVHKFSKGTHKFIQTNTDFKDFLKLKNMDRILEIVTRQQQSSTTIARHTIEAIRIDLKNVTAELKNEFSKQLNERFSQLKTYFQEVHTFDKDIANGDMKLIMLNVKALSSSLKEGGTKVNEGLDDIINIARRIMAGEIAYRSFRLAQSLFFTILSIKKNALSPGDAANDLFDKTDDLTNAIYSRIRADRLMDAFHKARDKANEINGHLKENERKLAVMRIIIEHFKKIESRKSKAFEIPDDFEKLRDDFLNAYQNYNATLGTSDIEELGAWWEVIVEEACALINEDHGTHTNYYKYTQNTGLCVTLPVDVARLTEIYIEIYDFQFEMLDALAQYMRSVSGIVSAENMQNHFDKLSSKEAKSNEVLDKIDATAAFTLLIYKMQTFQTVLHYCSYLEYKNGGIKPDVCQGFNTDVSLLASAVIPTCTDRFHDIFYMPTQPTHKTDKAFVNLSQLAKGIPVKFRIPDSQWLIDAEWISERERHYAMYVEQFEVYLPTQKHSKFHASVTAKTIGGSTIKPNGFQYVIAPNHQLEYKYTKGPITYCRQQVFNDPYKYCNMGQNDFDQICPSSVTETRDRLYPSIYSQWSIVLNGFEDAMIPRPATNFSLAFGLKICSVDTTNSLKKRRRRNPLLRKKSVIDCCGTGQYWKMKQNMCSQCPVNTTSIPDGYYCS